MMQKQKKEWTGPRVVKVFFLVVLVGIVLFCFLLFLTIKTKSTSLVKKEPYSQVLNKPLTFLRDIYLIDYEYRMKDDYPLLMLDPHHPSFRSYVDAFKEDPPQGIYVAKIPAGQHVIFTNAVMYTNGVSGGSTPCLFGEINYQGTVYKVSYHWGDQSISRNFDHIPESWSFPMAPWQSKLDMKYYELPTAQWW